jgi:glycosyltransferase involved in cell wall biosynthesis
MTEASFIVITYNAAPTLERTLRSISAQAGMADYEILVVDDGSRDETRDVARRYAESDPHTRLVEMGTNQGRGAARAAGVANARGEWIATVDADIVLPTHWYGRCVSELADADAVAGIPLPDGDVQYVYSRYSLRPRPLPSYASITGNNALYRRSVFDQVSYDPSLRNGEDVALSKAMQDRGLRMRSIDDLHVRHEETKGFRDSVSWLYETGVGSSRQLRRYRQIRTADLAFAAWCVAVLAPLTGRGLPSVVRRLALPVAFTGLIGFAHTRNKFYLRRERPATIVWSSASNALLLFVYFIGRVRGLIARS